MANQGISNSICGQINLFQDNIKFEVFKPICTPPKYVCYTFPGQLEICVPGDSYVINYGGWTCTEYPVASWSYLGYCVPWQNEYWLQTTKTITTRKNYNGQIINQYNTSNAENVNSDVWTVSVHHYVQDSTTCGYRLPYYNQLKNGATWKSNWWGLALNQPTYLFYPTKIDIKNASGVITSTVSGNGTPTVRTMNATPTSKYNFSQPDLVRLYKRAFPGSRIAIENPTSTSVRAVEYYPLLPFIPMPSPSISNMYEIFRVDNSADSVCTIPPLVRWECLGSCSDGKVCPPGTCTTYAKGDDVCCIGQDGTVIAIVSKECQKADCSCEG